MNHLPPPTNRSTVMTNSYSAEPYLLLYTSLSTVGCLLPEFSSIDTSVQLAAGPWVPGMKAHIEPAKKKVGD